jgi:hypothetical protein
MMHDTMVSFSLTPYTKKPTLRLRCRGNSLKKWVKLIRIYEWYDKREIEKDIKEEKYMLI